MLIYLLNPPFSIPVYDNHTENAKEKGVLLKGRKTAVTAMTVQVLMVDYGGL
jgi:hypothetical protein